MHSLPPPDNTGTYQAPQVSAFGGALYSPVNQNVPPPTINPSNPPITAYGVQGPSGSNITTPQSQGSNGFLDVVTGALGNLAHGIGDALGTTSYLISKPLTETMIDPTVEHDAEAATASNMLKFIQTGGQQGSINPMDYFKYMNEKFESETRVPGIVKFAGEVGLDPLTYLSSGVLKGTQVGLRGMEVAGAAGIARDAIAEGMNPLISGMTKYEQAVDAAVGGISHAASGIVNASPTYPMAIRQPLGDIIAAGQNAADKAISFLPSDAAKDNARGILNQILPSGLVENILNFAPEEYTGIPTGPISDYLNKSSVFGKQLGLPDYIALPDFRKIARQQSNQMGYEAMKNVIAATGSAEPTTWANNLKTLYTTPSEQLDGYGGYVKSLIQEPSRYTDSDISALSKAVNGSLDTPNLLQTQSFNQVVGLYRRGALNTQQTIQSLANHLGADLANNPDAASPILDSMRTQDQKSLDFIDNLTKIKDPHQLFDTMGDYAANVADQDFNVGIQQQRLQNTLWNDWLNTFDSAANSKMVQNVNGAVRGIQSLGIQTLGMPFMQVAEVALRHIAEGGGMWQSNIDKDIFQAENAAIQNVPYDVRKAAYHGFTDQMDETLLQRVSGSNPVLGWLADKENFLNTWTNNSRNVMYLSYWRSALNQEIKAAAEAKGFTLRPDASAFMDAVKTPDVNATPELSGMDQRYVNDVMSSGIKVAPSRDAMDAYQRTLSANNINRYALTHDIDGDDVLLSNLSTSSRAVLRDSILTGDGTAASLADAADKAIIQEKAILKESPPVKAEIFQGAVDSIVNRMNSPIFGARDLNNSLGQIMGIQAQVADMPWMYRQAEYDAVQNAIRSPNGWRGAIHSEYNGNITDFLKRTDPILNQAYGALNAQGAKLGVDTTPITQLMESDRLNLQATWAVDRNFQDSFFASNPDKKNSLTWSDPGTKMGYYDQRQRIWDGYGVTHNKNLADLQQAQIQLADQLMGLQQAGAIPPDVNTISAATDAATAKDAITEVHPEFTEPEQAIDPTAQEILNLAEHGIQTGQTPTEIAGAINGIITPSAGDANPESILNPSSQAVESQISGAIGNSTISQSGNSALTIEQPDPSSYLGSKYAALESSVRPRIDEIVQNRLNNPKVPQPAIDFLKQRLEGMYTEYQQLPQDTQKIWNDVLDVASQRASQRITQGFTNYNDRSNFDALMLHFFPWWMHESQRWPWLTRTFVGKPTAQSMWQAYQDNTNQGYVPISELPVIGGIAAMAPGLNSLQINPTRMITPFNPIQPSNLFRSTNYDEGVAGTMQQLDRVFSTIGIQPFDIWDMAQSLAQNNLGAEVPTPIKAALNVARASNIPGVTALAGNIQQALPDNYRDYYTRMILSSNGFEPDKIYDDALSGDETAQQTLDVAQQQSSLVQTVLSQTGSAVRFRTPEYNTYQEARMKAVENMTGISQATQLAMRNDGISIRQLQAFTPQQRQELANLPGSTDFNELTEPLLNPAARKLRQQQREFYQTLDTERNAVILQQQQDDRRLQTGIISGVEWRKRYQDRAGAVSDLLADLKKSPAYRDVPVTADEQAKSRARFNLPPYVMSPEDMALQSYYSIKPETDVITGDVNWDKYFQDRQAVVDSNPTLKPILEERLAKNNTPQVVDFKQSASILRPYFGIKDSILAQYPSVGALVRQAQLIQNQDPVMGQQFRENNDQLKTLSTLVRRTQQQARLQFPQIDQALVKYYGAAPATYQTWAKKYEAPTRQANIPQYEAAT